MANIAVGNTQSSGLVNRVVNAGKRLLQLVASGKVKHVATFKPLPHAMAETMEANLISLDDYKKVFIALTTDKSFQKRNFGGHGIEEITEHNWPERDETSIIIQALTLQNVLRRSKHGHLYETAQGLIPADVAEREFDRLTSQYDSGRYRAALDSDLKAFWCEESIRNIFEYISVSRTDDLNELLKDTSYEIVRFESARRTLDFLVHHGFIEESADSETGYRINENRMRSVFDTPDKGVEQFVSISEDLRKSILHTLEPDVIVTEDNLVKILDHNGIGRDRVGIYIKRIKQSPDFYHAWLVHMGIIDENGQILHSRFYDPVAINEAAATAATFVAPTPVPAPNPEPVGTEQPLEFGDAVDALDEPKPPVPGGNYPPANSGNSGVDASDLLRRLAQSIGEEGLEAGFTPPHDPLRDFAIGDLRVDYKLLEPQIVKVPDDAVTLHPLTITLDDYNVISGIENGRPSDVDLGTMGTPDEGFRLTDFLPITADGGENDNDEEQDDDRPSEILEINYNDLMALANNRVELDEYIALAHALMSDYRDRALNVDSFIEIAREESIDQREYSEEQAQAVLTAMAGQQIIKLDQDNGGYHVTGDFKQFQQSHWPLVTANGQYEAEYDETYGQAVATFNAEPEKADIVPSGPLEIQPINYSDLITLGRQKVTLGDYINLAQILMNEHFDETIDEGALIAIAHKDNPNLNLNADQAQTILTTMAGQRIIAMAAHDNAMFVSGDFSQFQNNTEALITPDPSFQTGYEAAFNSNDTEIIGDEDNTEEPLELSVTTILPLGKDELVNLGEQQVDLLQYNALCGYLMEHHAGRNVDAVIQEFEVSSQFEFTQEALQAVTQALHAQQIIAHDEGADSYIVTGDFKQFRVDGASLIFSNEENMQAYLNARYPDTQDVVEPSGTDEYLGLSGDTVASVAESFGKLRDTLGSRTVPPDAEPAAPDLMELEDEGVIGHPFQPTKDVMELQAMGGLDAPFTQVQIISDETDDSTPLGHYFLLHAGQASENSILDEVFVDSPQHSYALLARLYSDFDHSDKAAFSVEYLVETYAQNEDYEPDAVREAVRWMVLDGALSVHDDNDIEQLTINTQRLDSIRLERYETFSTLADPDFKSDPDIIERLRLKKTFPGHTWRDETRGPELLMRILHDIRHFTNAEITADDIQNYYAKDNYPASAVKDAMRWMTAEGLLYKPEDFTGREVFEYDVTRYDEMATDGTLPHTKMFDAFGNAQSRRSYNPKAELKSIGIDEEIYDLIKSSVETIKNGTVISADQLNQLNNFDSDIPTFKPSQAAALLEILKKDGVINDDKIRQQAPSISIDDLEYEVISQMILADANSSKNHGLVDPEFIRRLQKPAGDIDKLDHQQKTLSPQRVEDILNRMADNKLIVDSNGTAYDLKGRKVYKLSKHASRLRHLKYKDDRTMAERSASFNNQYGKPRQMPK